MATSTSRTTSRREFLSHTALGTAGLILLPGRGFASANRRIQIAQIGCGRMGMEDMRGTMAHTDLCRIVAVCDLDRTRLDKARAEVEQFYKGKGETAVSVAATPHFREVLARQDVDAVIISPPDHWHALVAVEAALAGKDMYVQKPLTYDIAEAIALRTVVQAKRRILQTGSQQRSEQPWMTFRTASEAVRNGRIGQVKTVRIGVGQDKPKGQRPAPQPVPSTFDYDTWLGPAPQQPYMESRVHPQADYGRPGWITTEDFGLGMITNWGAHHVDIMQWALGAELSGPSAIEGRAQFMKDDVWTVHETYHVEMSYPGGVQVILDNEYPNGIRFEGTAGWVFCTRGAAQVTASDPNTPDAGRKALDASDPKILTAPFGVNDVRWPSSGNHYRNWLESIQSRQAPVAPIEQSSRSLEACAVSWIAMKLQRKLTWNPQTEDFVGDAAASALRSRRPRSSAYDLARIVKAAGL